MKMAMEEIYSHPDMHDPELEFKFLLGKIQRTKSIDFSLYRPGTLKRRIQSRLRATGCSSYSEYLLYLNKNSHEYDLLLDAMTINVTEFFRDSATFACLEKNVIPEIIRMKERSGKKVIRVWSAGSSYGEEAYSLAMLFSEALKEKMPRFYLRIFGTDIDANCIQVAKQGVYSREQVKKIPAFLLEKYFSFTGSGYELESGIKDIVRFSLHNLVSDNPLGPMDLILCRNVLIYFKRPLQESVCRNFYKTLHEDGFLVLGKVESLMGWAFAGLNTINLQERVYQKK